MFAESVNRVSLESRVRARHSISILVKRALDIAISLVALVVLAPLLSLIALAIKRDSPGPVIYRGARVGKDGKAFKILKFRTMYEEPASHAGPKVTAHDDPRVTPLGHWLRRTKLNELPQFWNVLIGEMSLVGPRPEDPTIACDWPAAAWDEILSVRPGITSPASVLYHDEEALLCTQDVCRQYVQELCPEKMRLDRLYVRRRGTCLDLDILLWTVLIILPWTKRQPPEELLFVGPITRLVHRCMSWIAADLFVSLIAFGISGLFWHAYADLHVSLPTFVFNAIMFAGLFSVTGIVLGVNRIAWSRATVEDVWDVFGAWVVATLLACVANLFTHAMPVSLVVAAAVPALCGFVVLRYRSRLATRLASRAMRHRANPSGARQPVLIVGSGPHAQYVASTLNRPGDSQGYHAFGFVDDDLFVQGMRVQGTRVLGICRDLSTLVAKHGIRAIILADPSISREQRDEIAEACRSSRTRLIVMPDVVDSLAKLCGGAPAGTPKGVEAGAGADADRLQDLVSRGGSAARPSLKSGRVEVM